MVIPPFGKFKFEFLAFTWHVYSLPSTFPRLARWSQVSGTYLLRGGGVLQILRRSSIVCTRLKTFFSICLYKLLYSGLPTRLIAACRRCLLLSYEASASACLYRCMKRRYQIQPLAGGTTGYLR